MIHSFVNMQSTLTWPGKQQAQTIQPVSGLISARLVEVFAPEEVRKGGEAEQTVVSALRSPLSNSQLATCNQLFFGDNLPALSHLLNSGYRGKVKLIYIDPPYQSGVTWRRKMRLRARKAPTMQTAADHIFAAQTQYRDTWSEADYLQFIYERLPLLRELLSESGSLWLHCDHRQAHHLRCLLEEVFGAENYLNTIAWRSQTARGAKVSAFYFPYSTHSIEIFAKCRSTPTTWNPPKRRIVLSEAEAAAEFMRDERGFFRTSDPGTYSFASLKALHDEGRLYAPFAGQVVIDEASARVYCSQGGNLAIKYYLTPLKGGKWQVERAVDNFWDDIPGLGTVPSEDLGYPTQKTEALLQRVIETASNPGDLVLDCFMGSGTTLAVAEKLGRRWLGIDANYGAIQTTRRRMQAKGAEFAVYQIESGERRVETRDQRSETDIHNSQFAIRNSHASLPSHPITLQITRNPQNPTTIEVQIIDYDSLAIAAQLSGRSISSRSTSAKRDWRTLIDSVEIDPTYDGQIFCAQVVDVPLKKSVQVHGTYLVQIPSTTTTVAIRLTDVLGEESMIVKQV